jgi:hypothetical protein
MADSRFGVHVSLHKRCTAISLDMWGDVIERVDNAHNDPVDTTTIVHPHGLADFVTYARQATGVTPSAMQAYIPRGAHPDGGGGRED